MRRRDFLKYAPLPIAMILGGSLSGCGSDGQPSLGNLGNNLAIDLATVESEFSSTPENLIILIVNHATDLLSYQDIEAYCENQNTQLFRDFLPFWGSFLGIKTATCSTTATNPDITVYFEDTIAPLNGRYAYHVGTSECYIGVSNVVANGENPAIYSTGDASHELLEAIANYFKIGTECCDPVEAHYYFIGSQYFSDFCTPAGLSLPGANLTYALNGSPQYDFLMVLSAPSDVQDSGGFESKQISVQNSTR